MYKGKKSNKIMTITLGTVLLSTIMPMNLVVNAAPVNPNSTKIKTNIVVSNEYKKQY